MTITELAAFLGVSRPRASQIISTARERGNPVSEPLTLPEQPHIALAIITSMLGVAFSMVDFLADGIQINASKTAPRLLLCLLVFVPPFLFSALDPAIFVTAIGFAGGFGEAFLNGLLPVAMVWVGRYRRELGGTVQLAGNKAMLIGLFAISVAVMVLELIFVLS